MYIYVPFLQRKIVPNSLWHLVVIKIKMINFLSKNDDALIIYILLIFFLGTYYARGLIVKYV